MYGYDDFDKQIVRERVAQFASQVERRLDGSLTEDEFRPLRLKNGVYLQLHAYMLRIAIPYGGLSSPQLRQLALIADKYDRGYGHFTTRTNIQFNWPKLRDVPAILGLLADVKCTRIQTSGNCVRNATTDAFAGAAFDEIEDPAPHRRVDPAMVHAASGIRLARPEIQDRGLSATQKIARCSRVHDVGVRIVRDAGGEIGYQIFVGGGLGRTPMEGKVLREFLPREELFAYLEAVLRVYNLEGRRDNKFKARIKILVHEIGIEAFRALVEAEYRAHRRRLANAGSERIRAHRRLFRRARLTPTCPKSRASWKRRRPAIPDLARFVEHNLFRHKQRGLCGADDFAEADRRQAPGDATSAADARRRRSRGKIFLRRDRASATCKISSCRMCGSTMSPKFSRVLKAQDLGTPQCRPDHRHPLLPRPRLLRARDRAFDPGGAGPVAPFRRPGRSRRRSANFSIKMSGCINACGHHHVGNIGILGLEKKGANPTRSPSAATPAKITRSASCSAPACPPNACPDAIDQVVGVYLAQRQPGRDFHRSLSPSRPRAVQGRIQGGRRCFA